MSVHTGAELAGPKVKAYKKPQQPQFLILRDHPTLHDMPIVPGLWSAQVYHGAPHRRLCHNYSGHYCRQAFVS